MFSAAARTSIIRWLVSRRFCILKLTIPQTFCLVYAKKVVPMGSTRWMWSKKWSKKASRFIVWAASQAFCPTRSFLQRFVTSMTNCVNERLMFYKLVLLDCVHDWWPVCAAQECQAVVQGDCGRGNRGNIAREAHGGRADGSRRSAGARRHRWTDTRRMCRAQAQGYRWIDDIQCPTRKTWDFLIIQNQKIDLLKNLWTKWLKNPIYSQS